jgi:hypothetical protein
MRITPHISLFTTGFKCTDFSLTTKFNKMQETNNLPQNPQFCQTDISGSAFSLHDLRCGNVLNYDTAEGEILPTVIDWQDLKWLTEDPKGFNLVHSGIRLTEGTVEKLGFDVIQEGWLGLNKFTWNVYDRGLRYNGQHLGEPDYIHDLQNIYYCLTGVMLSLS